MLLALLVLFQELFPEFTDFDYSTSLKLFGIVWFGGLLVLFALAIYFRRFIEPKQQRDE
jgi:uncharacterized membrane protein YbhN (UPF0104 family)